MAPMTKTDSQQTNEIVISSGSRLTIETIAEYIQRIRAGLDEAETVVLEFDPDVEMDITALQVFCSACKTAAAVGRRCIYRGPMPQALLDLSVAAGAERHKSCKNHNEFCFRQLGGTNTWEN